MHTFHKIDTTHNLYINDMHTFQSVYENTIDYQNKINRHIISLYSTIRSILFNYNLLENKFSIFLKKRNSEMDGYEMIL